MSNFSLTPIFAKEFDVSSYSDKLEKSMRTVGNSIREDLTKPTRTWEEKPNFRSTKVVADGQLSIVIYLAGDTEADKHYLWLNDGVEGKDITAKPKSGAETGEIAKIPRLKMRKTFSAKTIPGTLSSRRGSPTGGGGDPRDYNYPHTVHWTGIEARNFFDVVGNDWESKFVSEMDAAFGRIAVED